MPLSSARAIVLTALFGSLGGLVALGAVAPALGVDLGDPTGWIATARPEDVLAVTGWSAAALICLHLLVTTLAYAAARLAESPRWLAALRRVTVGPIRRAVDTIAVVTISLATLGPFGELTMAVAGPPLPIVVDEPAPRPARIRPPGHGGVGYTLGGIDTDLPAPAGPEEPVTHTVRPGDNLWKIACHRVRTSVARPDLGQVTGYWLELIEVNTPRLRSGDPDLIHPGELIVLPPIESDEEP